MQKRHHSKPTLDRREPTAVITARIVKTSAPMADS